MELRLALEAKRSGGNAATIRLVLSPSPITGVRDVAVGEQKVGLKPKGLWYSCGDAWKQWVRSEMPDKFERYKHQYELTLNPSKMLFLRSKRDVKAFEAKYLVSVSDDPADADMAFVDWAAVAADYGGIEICSDAPQGRFWYSGWDVPSGAVWSQQAVKDLRPV